MFLKKYVCVDIVEKLKFVGARTLYISLFLVEWYPRQPSGTNSHGGCKRLQRLTFGDLLQFYVSPLLGFILNLFYGNFTTQKHVKDYLTKLLKPVCHLQQVQLTKIYLLI